MLRNLPIALACSPKCVGVAKLAGRLAHSLATATPLATALATANFGANASASSAQIVTRALNGLPTVVDLLVVYK